MEVQPRTSGSPTLNYSGTGRIPWESALKVKEVQEGWMFLEREVLKVQEELSPCVVR